MLHLSIYVLEDLYLNLCIDYVLSLKLCGPIKSWKRPQDPTNGTPKGFGFWEFESAEGVLRALRLLTKLNVDGQELMVCLYLYLLFLKSVCYLNTH